MMNFLRAARIGMKICNTNLPNGDVKEDGRFQGG